MAMVGPSMPMAVIPAVTTRCATRAYSYRPAGTAPVLGTNASPVARTRRRDADASSAANWHIDPAEAVAKWNVVLAELSSSYRNGDARRLTRWSAAGPVLAAALPWPAPAALMVARSIAHKLLATAPTPAELGRGPNGVNESSSTDWRSFLPTPAMPSPAWSPAPVSHPIILGGSGSTSIRATWMHVHTLLVAARAALRVPHSPSVSLSPPAPSSTTPTNRSPWTGHDHNLALFAWVQTQSPASSALSASALYPRLFPTQSNGGKWLSPFPDTQALGIYASVATGRNIAWAHDTARARMSRVIEHGGGDGAPRELTAMVNLAAAERALHALAIGAHHSHLPLSALVSLADAVAPWFERQRQLSLPMDEAEPRYIATLLSLAATLPTAETTANEYGRVVTELLARLAATRIDPWPLMAHHAALQWSASTLASAGADRFDPATRALAESWAAELEQRGSAERDWQRRPELAEAFWTLKVTRTASVSSAVVIPPAPGALSLLRHRMLGAHPPPPLDPWHALIGELLSHPYPTANMYASTVVALAHSKQHLQHAIHVFHAGVAAGLAPVRAAPELVNAMLAARNGGDESLAADAIGIASTIPPSSAPTILGGLTVVLAARWADISPIVKQCPDSQYASLLEITLSVATAGQSVPRAQSRSSVNLLVKLAHARAVPAQFIEQVAAELARRALVNDVVHLLHQVAEEEARVKALDHVNQVLLRKFGASAGAQLMSEIFEKME
ncbi:hypothetical protein BC828DRAFT_372146 [Blastocladiella britannica]|nr:hypothetical protein BC828DRAFT_372146 [Blastocladiella britannica]